MKTVLVILLLLVLTSPVSASSAIDTVSDFMQAVRWIVHCSNDDMLPDSVLLGLTDRSLVWVSTDIGGIEAIYRIITAASTEFYAFPDTVTEILYATLIDDSETFSIKAFSPAFYEDAFNKQTTLESGVGDQQPRAYNYWADTIQLLPIPINVDTIYFKCYVEHPLTDAATDTIRLRSPYVEAALEWCCHLVYKRWQEPGPAAMHLANYEGLRAKLITRYAKPSEIMPR